MYCGAWVEISQPLLPIGTKTPIFITYLALSGECLAWRCILHCPFSLAINELQSGCQHEKAIVINVLIKSWRNGLVKSGLNGQKRCTKSRRLCAIRVHGVEPTGSICYAASNIKENRYGTGYGEACG
ncbi:Hypothetical protein AKI40_2538 [Enterobacter sp. FY-07]|nr:Hypothetical protein AKI40_2538 [Enterobacter sp. FY-07]